MRGSSSWGALAVVGVCVWLTGCSATHRSQARLERAKLSLADSVQLYWEAVRWGEAAEATVVWAGADTRLRLTEMLADPAVRLTDTQVLALEIEVDRPHPDRPKHDLHRGTIVVRLEGFEETGQRGITETIRQSWVETPTGWFIDAERSPLGVDRPWVVQAR